MVGVSSDAAQTWQHHKRTSSVTHSKEKALDQREFELLYEGAQKIDGYRGLEAQFIVFVAGRLGLRAGEIAHMKEGWVDWREKLIQIPAHQPCTKGKDGSMCGSCRQQIQQCVRVNDDVELEDVEDNWWRPKTEAAVRGVPFGWSPRAELLMERFFDQFDRFERSYTAIGRRVKHAAEESPELNPEDVHPHCLRASAATLLAGKGLSAHTLCSMFGWVSMATAEVYLSRSSDNTKRALRAAVSK